MWTYEEAQAYLDNSIFVGKKLGLDGMRIILKALGNPEKKLKFIHLAGTNGKGSTAAVLASILAVAAYKTGLYTSPYIENFTERIRIFTDKTIPLWRQKHRSGEIAEADFAKALYQVKQAISDAACELKTVNADFTPSFFELITCAALVYYQAEQVDVVVWETGLGGEFDPTNVIANPMVTIITALHYDHCQYLGQDIADIAKAKAGIIKPNCPVILFDPRAMKLSSEEQNTVLEVITAKAQSMQAPLHLVKASNIRSQFYGLDGQDLSWASDADSHLQGLTVFTHLLGRHQSLNVASAVEAAYLFLVEQQGLDYQHFQKVVKEGLQHTYWPARLELLNTKPKLLLDGAHNLQGVEVLADFMHDYLSGQGEPSCTESRSETVANTGYVLLCSFLADRDYVMMLNRFVEIVGQKPLEIICLSVDAGSRGQTAGAIASKLKSDFKYKNEVNILDFEDIKAISNHLKKLPTGVLSLGFGSLYLASTIKKIVV